MKNAPAGAKNAVLAFARAAFRATPLRAAWEAAGWA